MSLQEKIANIMGMAQGSPTSSRLPGAMTFAAGGVVDRPAKVIVGEAGPEAIIPITEEYMKMPLNKILAAIMEKRRVAEEMQAKAQEEQAELAEDEVSPAAKKLGPQQKAPQATSQKKPDAKAKPAPAKKENPAAGVKTAQETLKEALER